MPIIIKAFINYIVKVFILKAFINKGVVHVADSRKFVAKTKDVSLTVRRAESF